jgi:hypothetical protein
MRSQRKAATKVSVRQRPCGTPLWHLGDQTLAALTAAVLAGHVGLGPGLVDEDQAARIKAPLVLLPSGAPAGDVGAVLLGGEQAFF